MTLVVAMVASVLLSAAVLGGAAFYLVRSGRIPPQKATPGQALPGKPADAMPSHVMALEPMVANLADAGGTAYLKMALTLRIADDAVKKEAPAKEEKTAKGVGAEDAAVRDTVLTVVGRQTADGLLAPEGKEKLKAELKDALAKHNPELKVTELYFIDFLVQR